MTTDMLPPADAPVRTLIDMFLEEQSSTTAVERFSQHHQGLEEDAPAQARWYRDLMPATPPGPRQQYAFEVDLDACTGCKACVTACSSLNGLDEGETWRSVGLLTGADTQHVTSACHHCVDPGCLSGCPVDAYEKDPVTGVVVHLDDQCIGCRYCTLTCPYEVPQFDRSRGIVRKCDMCHGRLAEGEAPACVQGCPTNAISITIVDLDDVGQVGNDPWPFVAPDPAVTRPVTQWRGTRELGGTVAADRNVAHPHEAHTPLAVMLVLTQASVGLLLADLLLGLRQSAWGTAATGAVVSLVIAVVALAASVLHLGRPHLAWRAVVGLRHSWLSREIVAFGGFAAFAGLAASTRLGWMSLPSPVEQVAPWMAAALGVIGVWSSVMIYAVTGRRWWRIAWSAPRFALTTLAGGTALLTATVAIADDGGAEAPSALPGLAVAVAVFTALKLAADALVLLWRGSGDGELARTARLLAGQLSGPVRLRAALAVVGVGLLMSSLAVAGDPEPSPGIIALIGLGAAAVVGGEVVERWLFFVASSPVRMPGQR